MKHIWLIAFLFLAGLGKAHCQISWLPKNLILKEKLDFNYVKFTSAQKTDQNVYGININTGNLSDNFKIDFTTGNLSYSGSLSKLNSPSLSSSLSPFYFANCNSSLITSSLPSLSSFSKPISYFAQCNISGRKKSPFTVNTFYVPENNSFAFSIKKDFTKTTKDKSLITGLLNTNKNTFSFSITAGLFPIEGLSDDSWFFKKDYYSSTFIEAAQIQASINLKKFNSLFVLNGYQSPYDDFRYNFRNENLIQLKNTKISFSEFYNYYNDYLTSGKKSVSEVMQIKFGITNHHFTSNKILVKKGFSSFCNLDLYNQEDDIKVCGGLGINGKNYNADFYFTANTGIFPKDSRIILEDITLYNKNYFKYKRWSFKINESFYFAPSKDFSTWTTSQNFFVQAEFNSPLSCSAGLNVELKQKNWKDNKINFQVSTNIIFHPKWKPKVEIQSKWEEDFSL